MARKNKDALQENRLIAEQDLYAFATLVNPGRMYGQVHKEVFKWMTREDARDNQLILLPRGHQKSHMMAVWCAWWLTNNPESTISYISATADLAEKQLYAIKGILNSKQYRMYWPEMTRKDEGKRTRWTTSEVIVDHPKRELENVRDPSIRTAGLTTNTAGSHADVLIYDDVVVPQNAYTSDGRKTVMQACSQFASVKNAGGIVKAVGTRYHPRDQYQVFREQKTKLFDEDYNQIGWEPIYEVYQEAVEVDNTFLWPRTHRDDGKSFGFDIKTLAHIDAEYDDKTQFYAQYYNDPNDPDSNRISREKFQYFDQRHINLKEGKWHYKDTPLNVYAAIDFAFEVNKTADYTSIVVVGIDPDKNVYVLEIDRFKTDKLGEYFKHVMSMHVRWEFKKLRAEVTGGQSILTRDLKDEITREGLRLTIEEHRPTRWSGKKEERIAAILEHRYENGSIWHYRGGYTSILEDELVLARPPHDDVKDALACVVEIAIPPRQSKRRFSGLRNVKNIKTHPRFGGYQG